MSAGEPNYHEILKPDVSTQHYPQLSPNQPTLPQYHPGERAVTRVVVLERHIPAIAPVDTTPRVENGGVWTSLKSLGRSIRNVILQPGVLPTAASTESAPSAAVSVASAPPEDSPPVSAVPSGPIGVFSLLQMVYAKTPVDVLFRYNCNCNTLTQAGMNINNFFDRDYSLAEVHALIPEYSQIRSLGLNISHFTVAKHWSIVEFSKLYNIPLKTLLRAQGGFDVTPQQMVRAGLKSVHLADAGITARELIDRPNNKPDFAFWFQLQCTPSDFSGFLKGGLNEVADMGLTDEQKRSLRSNSWSRETLREIDGLTKEQASRFWPKD